MPLDPPLEEPPEEIRSALAPLRNGLSVAVLAAGNPFAVGAIIRVCHSFLVREVLLIGTEPHYEKASMGMHRLEEVRRLPDVEAFFEYVHGRPVWALEREASRRSLYEARAFPWEVVLAFGSERFGFPPGFLGRCDDVLAIPLYGVNNSLPVAVAAGITLSWWAHLRYAPGTVIVPGG
ncbi:MAG: TrmH family RNA methyltransferase [Myxococcales bacterium]|nr:TrmH family RNA methyltransferase [Polyangiaceae bacterium]MDW8248384.1 TrmH family RNA methyltransferase [Myxococcales bacterium]